MSELQLFSSHDLSKWEVKPARQNASGQGKTVYLDRQDPDFISEEVTVAWPIRPSMVPPEGSQIKDSERLNLEVSIPRDQLAFTKKANELDDLLKTKLFEDRVACFGSTKAKALASKESVNVLYKPMLKEGGMNKDGTQQYPDTVRGKVDGWSSQIKKLNFEEKEIGGQKTKMIKDCEWSPRYVNQGFKSGDTKFFLCLGKNPATGKEKYTDRLPCVDETGEKRLRYVGPEDCKRGSKVAIVFRIPKVYITETAGPTLSIKEVYIKNLPPKEEVKVMEGAELVDEDELLALLELSSSTSTTPSTSVSTSTLSAPVVSGVSAVSAVSGVPSTMTSTVPSTVPTTMTSTTPMSPQVESGKHLRDDWETLNEFQELSEVVSKPSKKKKETS